MNRRVVYHELAERELNDVARYYSRAGADLAVAFLDAVDHALDAISEHPTGGRSLGQDDIRIRRVRRFPYNVVYRTLDSHVRVLAIAGQRRRPFYWAGRT